MNHQLNEGHLPSIIMEYGNVGMAQKKMATALNAYKMISSIACYTHNVRTYELYLSLSGVFISKKTDTNARKRR